MHTALKKLTELVTGNPEVSTSIPTYYHSFDLWRVQIQKIETNFFASLRPVVILNLVLFHLNYCFRDLVWPISFCVINTAQGNKIYLFHIKKVFCPYAFGILIEKADLKSVLSYQMEVNDLCLLFVRHVPEGVGGK